MKLNLNSAIFAAALLLPAMGAIAADAEKEQPRPAQESRGGTTTGKEATKTSKDTAPTPTPVDTKEAGKEQSRPADAKESTKQQPRPAQESRGGTTTGRDATKAPETDKAK